MKNLLLVALTTFFISCSTQKNKQNEVEQLPINIEKLTPINFPAFFEEITYIPLESNDPYWIGDVDRLQVSHGNVYILSSKRVFCFNAQTGKGLFEIANLGMGPGEYKSVYDMYVDEKHETIELLDMNGQKVQKYNKEGHFMEEFSIPFQSFAFHKINNTDYFFYNNNMPSELTDSKLIVYDSSVGKIKTQHFPIDKHLSSYFFLVEGNNFSWTKDGVSFFSCPSSTIYNIDPSSFEVSEKYVMDFGKHQVPTEFYQENYNDIFDFSQKAIKHEYIYFVNNFGENDNYIAISFRLDKDNYLSIYSKTDKKTITGKAFKDDTHFNDTSFSLEYYNFPFAIDNEKLYFLMQPEQILSASTAKGAELPFKNSIKPLNEQSNPILVICKFKSQTSFAKERENE